MTTENENNDNPSLEPTDDLLAPLPGGWGETLIEPENPVPAITMSDLPVALREAALRAGWTELTRVQSSAIPYVLAGRDMMIQSRTGSGKTGAFVLPILDRIDPQLAQCQALVLVPTRELAQQVSKEVEMLAGDSGVRSVGVYGGTAYGPQLDAFRNGAHIVVGTPGRILDHLLRRSLNLDKLRVLIFDEADRMMSMGFYPDMREVQSYLPRRRTGYMFSATYPISVRRLAEQFLDKPGFLSLSHDAVHVTDTEHVYYEVPGMDKDRGLVRIIELENPESAIIFCNTKMRVNYVATVLQRFGYDADQLTSDLNQGVREKVLTQLRDHKLRFLVATDVAARGIDITKLSHVINYEVPEDPESYIHRTGRTGRAGESGVAISLVDFAERSDFVRLTKRFNIDMEQRPMPSDEDVETIVAERLTVLLEENLRSRDKLKVERMKRLIPLARSLSESEDGLALLTMVLDDTYQQILHSPPPVPESERRERQAGSRQAESRGEGEKPRRSGGSGGGRRRRS